MAPTINPNTSSSSQNYGESFSNVITNMAGNHLVQRQVPGAGPVSVASNVIGTIPEIKDILNDYHSENERGDYIHQGSMSKIVGTTAKTAFNSALASGALYLSVGAATALTAPAALVAIPVILGGSAAISYFASEPVKDFAQSAFDRVAQATQDSGRYLRSFFW